MRGLDPASRLSFAMRKEIAKGRRLREFVAVCASNSRRGLAAAARALVLLPYKPSTSASPAPLLLSNATPTP